MIWVAVQMILLLMLIAVPGEALPLPAAFRALGAAMALIAGGLGLSAAYELKGYFSAAPNPRVDASLRVNGPYKYVRHPMYSSVILFAAGYSLIYPSWSKFVLVGTIVIFFFVKSRYEERLLLDKFPEYSRYRQKVGAFVPKVTRRR